MKLWASLLVLGTILVASTVGFVTRTPPQESTAQEELEVLQLTGIRADARFNRTWDLDEVEAALRDAGFQSSRVNDFTLHAQREGEPRVVLLAMGYGVTFHVLHELEEPVRFEPGEDDALQGEAQREWEQLEDSFYGMLSDFERAYGVPHEDVRVEPLVTRTA